ncbi:MAG: hypothetical protein AAB855_00415, partial [Patescibacteria group bacterium]
MLKLQCCPAAGKRATFGVALFVILCAGFFIFPSARVSAQVQAPEAAGPIGLPTPHLLKVLEQTPGPNREGAADASRFAGTVKIGGATAATRSALQIAKIDLLVSDEDSGLTELLRLGRVGRNTWRFAMTRDHGLYLYPTDQTAAQNPDFHLANSSGTPFATFSPDSGNVGIGTTTPKADFDVGGVSGSGALRTVFARQGEGNTEGSGTFLGVKAWGTQQSAYAGKMFSLESVFYGNTNSSINFYRGGSKTGGFLRFATNNGTEQMTIDADGRVGIGVNNPGQKLDVAGNISLYSADSAYTTTFIANTGTGEALTYYDAIDGNFAGSDYASVGQTNAGSLKYRVGGNSPDASHRFFSGNSELFTILKSGNIGIGTDDPKGKLHINSNLDAGPNSATDGSALVIGPSNGTHLELDDNELHAMNVAAASDLHLNADGGDVIFWNGVSGMKVAITDGGIDIPADGSDGARLSSTASNAQTKVYLDVNDDANEEINIRALGWSDPQHPEGQNRGTINLIGGNINAEIADYSDRAFTIKNSSGANILKAARDGTVTLNKLAFTSLDNTTLTALKNTLFDSPTIKGPVMIWPNPAIESWGGLDIRLDKDGGSNDSFVVSDTGTERFRVDGNTGNVGIGTASPGAKLTIQTPASYSGDTIRFEAKAEPDYYNLKLNTVVTDGVVRWVFNQKNGTDYNNVLAFDRGKVGIGTAEPGAKLDIAGDARVNGWDAVFRSRDNANRT